MHCLFSAFSLLKGVERCYTENKNSHERDRGEFSAV